MIILFRRITKDNRLLKYFHVFQRSFFSYGSPVTLGVMRILFGACTAYWLIGLIKNLEENFSEKGILPTFCSDQIYAGKFSFLHQVTDFNFITMFFYGVLISTLLMVLGLFSRIATVLTTVGVLSIMNRNSYATNGGIYFLAIILIILSFSFSGNALSLDNWIHTRLKMNNGWIKHVFHLGHNKYPDYIPLWPQHLIFFQVAVIYFSTVTCKLLLSSWRDGSVLYYVLHSPKEISSSIYFPEFMTMAPWTIFEAYGTLLVEIFIVISVIIPRYRKYAIFAGTLLHVGMAYLLDVPFFSLIMICSYVTFFRGKEIENLISIVLEWFRQKFFLFKKLAKNQSSSQV